MSGVKPEITTPGSGPEIAAGKTTSPARRKFSTTAAESQAKRDRQLPVRLRSPRCGPAAFKRFSRRQLYELVRWLTLIYALLDKADGVDAAHLHAALAVWCHWLALAEFLFVALKPVTREVPKRWCADYPGERVRVFRAARPPGKAARATNASALALVWLSGCVLLPAQGGIGVECQLRSPTVRTQSPH